MARRDDQCTVFCSIFWFQLIQVSKDPASICIANYCIHDSRPLTDSRRKLTNIYIPAFPSLAGQQVSWHNAERTQQWSLEHDVLFVATLVGYLPGKLIGAFVCKKRQFFFKSQLNTEWLTGCNRACVWHKKASETSFFIGCESKSYPIGFWHY